MSHDYPNWRWHQVMKCPKIFFYIAYYSKTILVVFIINRWFHFKSEPKEIIIVELCNSEYLVLPSTGFLDFPVING